MTPAEYDDENIFARIIRGEASCVKIFETDAILAFMDVFPQSEGHCLVIHKKEKSTDLFSISSENLSGLIEATQRVARAVKDGLQPSGIRIMQFNGRAAGQTVYHLHFHIIPVYENKPVSPHASGDAASADELEPIAKKIIAAL